MYIVHPLIKKDSIESRTYQESILQTCIKYNTLVVLPTGLGKTPISVLLSAYQLEKYPGSKILVLAPTKPLANQHYKSFKNFLEVHEEEFVVLTGEIKPEDRKRLYKEKSLFFATPQTIENDIGEERLSLKDFSLLVIDEAHHAVGGYAYPLVAKAYQEQAKHQKILGLTASPGGTREKIDEISKNIGIEKVEIRTELSDDVIPYIKEKEVEWVSVDLPESFKKLRDMMQNIFLKKVEGLKKMRLVFGGRVSKKALLKLQGDLVRSMRSGNKSAIIAMSLVGQVIRLDHALVLLETQGISMLDSYWKKLKEEKKAEMLLKMKEVSNAVYMTRELKESGYRHPKMGKLCSIVGQELRAYPNAKIIVFATYRDTVKEIVSVLKGVEGARPVQFVGQREGMTQKKQMITLNEFKIDIHNILVSTSVAEEGIDISDMNMGIFYEPVPGSIRSLQRRGRVGRKISGKIIILMTKGTRDEAYHWSSISQEKTMKGIVHGMREGQKGIGDF